MRENYCAPPTIFCQILYVLPSPTAPGRRWVVTVADRQGMTVTVDLQAEELHTYERFQAGLLRETGSPFRYLPNEPRIGPTQAPSVPDLRVAVVGKEESVHARVFSLGVDSDSRDMTQSTAFETTRILP